MDFLEDHIDTGANTRSILQGDDCTVVQLKDQTGEGIMRIHMLFDGVYLLYNDFHMRSCVSQFSLKDQTPFLAIDHCRAGRIETEWKPGTYTYLQEKELRLDDRKNHSGNVVFPLGHYYGITLGFNLSIAESAIQRTFPGFSVCLAEIREKYIGNHHPFVIKNEPGIEHILSELYHVPSRIRKEYFCIKTLELLLYLDALEISDSLEERPYFYKSQVEKMKAVHDLITEDLKSHYTIEELAKQVSVSPTALKSGFKQIYGDSLYSYLRRVRLNTAAGLLKSAPDMSIGEVASAVGYENQGKFSTAFKSMMGISPLEYKKQV